MLLEQPVSSHHHVDLMVCEPPTQHYAIVILDQSVTIPQANVSRTDASLGAIHCRIAVQLQTLAGRSCSNPTTVRTVAYSSLLQVYAAVSTEQAIICDKLYKSKTLYLVCVIHDGIATQYTRTFGLNSKSIESRSKRFADDCTLCAPMCREAN